jgi:hypothetical protein
MTSSRYGFASKEHADSSLHPHLLISYPENNSQEEVQAVNSEDDQLSTPEATLAVENGMLKVSKPETAVDTMRVYISHIPVAGKDLTVFCTLKGDPMANYPEGYGRLVYARIIDENKNPSKVMFAVTQSQEFESVFYFENINSEEITLEFQIEGTEDFYISNLTAHCSPDVMYREFENGLVLINPDLSKPYTFNLEELFPGKTFYKIQGTQDPDVNNGAEVKSATLKPYDGLFLQKSNPSDIDNITNTLNDNQPYLYQNRPNPFNGDTSIRYNLPENPGSARLRIVNAVGLTVKTIDIIDTKENEVVLASNSLTSGVYFYSLIVDNVIIDTKRMVVK